MGLGGYKEWRAKKLEGLRCGIGELSRRRGAGKSKVARRIGSRYS